MPMWQCSSRSCLSIRLPVMRCFGVTRWRHSSRISSMRGPTVSVTGRGRGDLSLRTGSDSLRYLLTVFRLMPDSRATELILKPSANTLWRITWTVSTRSIPFFRPPSTFLLWIVYRASGNCSISEQRVHTASTASSSRPIRS